MPIQFEVTQKVKLNEAEKEAVKNKEALFFYHTWIRSEFELIEIAHDLLLNLSDCGLKANYQETSEYKVIESLIKQSGLKLANSLVKSIEDYHGKVRLNCTLTGKFEWIDSEYMPELYNDIIWTLSDYITASYGIENYFCGYHEGNWGLWHNWESEDY